MPLRKPWMRLVPLGTLAAVGLSACASLSPHRTTCPPQVASTPAVVPGPAAPDSSATADVGPPPAPPAPPVPGKVPGLNAPGLNPNESFGATPPQSPSPSPSADTNRDDFPPQRPSDVPSRLGQHMSPPDSEASPDAPSRFDAPPRLEIPPSPPSPELNDSHPGNDVSPPSGSPKSSDADQGSTTPADKPTTPLARLKKRIYDLTHRPAKPATDPAKDANAPPADPSRPPDAPPAVGQNRRALPSADPDVFVRADSRPRQSLFLPTEGQAAPVPVVVETPMAPILPGEVRAKFAPSSAAIEDWPYGPTATSQHVSESAEVIADFNPIPVEEYQAAVSKLVDDITKVEDFVGSQNTNSDGLAPTAAAPASTDPNPSAISPVPAGTVPIESVKTHMTSPVQAGATTSSESLGHNSFEVPPQVEPQPTLSEMPPSETLPPSVPATASPQFVIPQVAVPPVATPQAIIAPTSLPPVPPTAVHTPAAVAPSPVGGRYGQPAWMWAAPQNASNGSAGFTRSYTPSPALVRRDSSPQPLVVPAAGPAQFTPAPQAAPVPQDSLQTIEGR